MVKLAPNPAVERACAKSRAGPLTSTSGDTVMAFSEIELARVRKALDAFMAKRRPPAHIREKLDKCGASRRTSNSSGP